MTSPEFAAFKDWEEVLAYTRKHGLLYYQGAMDYRPIPIYAEVVDDGAALNLTDAPKKPGGPVTEPFKLTADRINQIRKGPGK